MLHAIGILDLRIEVSNPLKRPLLHPLAVVAYVLGEATRARPVVLRERRQLYHLARRAHGKGKILLVIVLLGRRQPRRHGREVLSGFINVPADLSVMP